MAGKKVMLIMPTFWDVIAPSVGIVALRSFLQQFGHKVRTVNLNTERKLWHTQNKYFETLGKYVSCTSLIPRLGTELLGFHMNARVFKDDLPGEYSKYIETLLREHFQHFLNNIASGEMDAFIEDLDKVIDAHFEMLVEAIPALMSDSPEYVGCTALSSTLGTAMFLLKEIKERFPEVKTVLGGPGPYAGIGEGSENMTRLAEKCTFVDKIIFGEGELVFKKYIEEGHEGKKIISAKTFGMEPLVMDTLPHLDYSDLKMDGYFNIGIGASRGCPYMCSFCSEAKMWGSFRKMSTERIAEEIKAQKEKHGKDKFYFTDSLLNHSLTPLVRLMLEEDIRIKFDCYLRVDEHAQNSKMTDLWAEGGLSRVRLGMESAAPNVLKIMNKKITPEEQAKALRCLASSGIRTTTYWIAGHPHETESDFQETLEFIRENKDYLYELDLAVFYFYGDGEIGLSGFARDFGGVEERFGSEFRDLSVFKYYRLSELRPSRKEAFDRAIRFMESAKELGILCNPSSVFDLMAAERRWEDLRGVKGCAK